MRTVPTLLITIAALTSIRSAAAQVASGDIRATAVVVDYTVPLGPNPRAEVSTLGGTMLQNLPIGQDVTNGFALSVASGPSDRPANAQLGFQLTSNATTLTANLTSSANVGPMLPLVGFSYWALSGAAGRVAVQFTSSAGPVPVWVDVDLPLDRYQCAGGCDFSSSEVSIPGVGTLQCPRHGQCTGPACPSSFAAWVDAAGLLVTLTTDSRNAGDSGWCTMASSASSFARVTLRRRAAAEPYGAACGLTLATIPTSTLTALETIDAVDATLVAPFGSLLIGTQQIVFLLPISACPIRNEALVAVPLGFDANGRASFSIPRLPPAGLFTLQAVSYSGTTLHTSNGLQL